MDLENQATIQKLAESEGADNLIVVLGATDLEGAEITAETVTIGDPSFAGSLAGVSLGLPVYHILESKMRDRVPKDIYEKNVGLTAMVVDTQQIEFKFQDIRNTRTANS
jgi:betaine reductase